MSNDPALEAFDGVARLFPLPNLVLFPNVIQGLHLFEPRFRELAKDSIESDGLFAMAVFKPGWEVDYEGSPALEPIACLGHIMDHEQLPDGRYNLRLRGVTRIRLIRELSLDTPYRMAKAEIVEQEKPNAIPALSALRKKLSAAVLARFEKESGTHRQLLDLFTSEAPLEQVCDMISYALPMPADFKYQLLSELNVAERIEIIVYAMAAVRKTKRKFPPEFSIN